MSPHLRSESLVALLELHPDGSPDGAAAVHLAECPACRRQLEAFERVRVRLRAAAVSSPTSTTLEEHVMHRVLAHANRDAVRTPPAPSIWRDWSVLLRPQALRWSVGAALVLFIIVIAASLQNPSQAWTLEQSIAAVRPMQGVYLAGRLDGHMGVQIWIRGDPDRSHVERMVLRADNGLTIRVHGNRTIYYTAGDQTAYTDEAQTAGIAPWPGAAFLDLLKQVSTSYEVDSRTDILRMRKVTVLRTQLVDAEGPKSFELEFEPSSKLLTRMVFWRNLQRSGAPAFAATVRYYAEMPETSFHVDVPDTVAYRERPISIPNEMVGLLAAAEGVPLSSTSPEVAIRQVVEEMYHAVVAGDLARVRALAPVATLWSDAQLYAVLGGAGGRDLVTDLVSVGEARPRGASSLGPLMVVPVVVRHRDGGLYDEKIIVQIRPAADGARCVIFAPYGRPYPAGDADGRR